MRARAGSATISSAVSTSLNFAASAEREGQLVRIQQLEDDDVGAAELQVLEPLDHRVRIIEQVRDQDHQAALEHRLGQLVQRPRDIGPLAGLQPLEPEQQGVQVAGSRRRGQTKADLLVEGDQTGRVPLPMHQEREGRSQHGTVFQLASSARAPRYAIEALWSRSR